MSNFDLRDFMGVLRPVDIINLEQFDFSGFSIDSRTLCKNDVFIALKGEKVDGHDFVGEAFERGASACVVEHRVGEYPQFVVGDTWKAFRSTALFLRREFGGLVVSVVGSVGKTTTKELLYSILSSRFTVCKTDNNENNWVGVSKALLKLLCDYSFCVVECGTNHPGEMSEISSIVRPDAVLFTPIAPVHLGNFGSMEDIVEEKLSVLECAKSGLVMCDADNGFMSVEGAYSYSVSDVADVYLKDKIVEGSSYRLEVVAFGDPYVVHVENGFIHESNVVGALGMAKLLVPDLREDEVNRGISRVSIPGYRMKRERVDSTDFILDCYNSSPTAVKYAVDRLSSLPGRKLLIAGDMLELGKMAVGMHEEIGLYISGKNIDVFGFGELAIHIVSACRCNDKAFFVDMDELVDRLLQVYRKYSAVLIKGSRALRMEDIFLRFKEKLS